MDMSQPLLPSLGAPNAGMPDFQALVEQAQVGILVTQEGRFLYANAKLVELLGRGSARALNGSPYLDIVHADDHARVAEIIRRRLVGEEISAYECRIVRADGSSFDARVYGRLVMFGGKPSNLVTLGDISDLTRAMHECEWNAQMLSRSELLCRSGSIEIDLANRSAHISRGLLALAGVRQAPSIGGLDRLLRLVPPEERRHVLAQWQAARPGVPFEFKHRLLRRRGTPLLMLHRGVIEAAAGSTAVRGVAMLQDITAQAQAQQRLQQLANFHPATGLPNRHLLLERLQSALLAAGAAGRPLAVLHLHIAQLVRVEQTMGFATADALAAATAQRLTAACAEWGEGADALAHIGDADFALLLPGAEGPIERAAATRAAALIATLKEPLAAHGTEFFLHAKVGIALFPHDARQPEQLLECAQAAGAATPADQPYGAELGRGFGSDFGQFSSQTSQRALRRMGLETALHRALIDNTLRLHYQPQIDLNDGRITGVEALLRWQCAPWGEVPPTELVQIAEECGLYAQLGEWVMRAACLQSVAWAQAGLPPLRMVINLSPNQLQQTPVSRRLQDIMLQTGADPACFGVEVTEAMFASRPEHARNNLRELHAIGVQVAIDDVGIGRSNLGLLRSLPLDTLKIDRSLVHDVTAATEDVSLTRAVLAMAYSLHLKVLAEGVETEGQLLLLAANGCDAIQGHLFSEALPADAVAALLENDARLPERFHLRRQRKRTLLLVDDEDGVLSSLRRLLRQDGYHIVSAASGADGMRLLAEHDVDVILTDQRLPGMTGVDLLRHAKELYPDTVRLVLSGYTELQSITDAINEGAIYKFLTKPWDGERLRAHIREAFRHKEMADENRRLALEVKTANDGLARANEQLQRLLGQQQERVKTEEGRAVGALQMLESLPAAVIGIDNAGMVVFVNRRGRYLLESVQLPGYGADADLLPAGLREVWRRRDAEPVRVPLPGGSCLAVCSELRSGRLQQGHLIVVTADTANLECLP